MLYWEGKQAHMQLTREGLAMVVSSHLAKSLWTDPGLKSAVGVH